MNINPLNILKIGIFIVLSLFILMLFHVIVGFLGFQYFFGTLVSIIITISCIFFKFPLPLTISSFFGIIYVLEWHWFFAIIITLPGLMFLSPRKFTKMFNTKTFKSGFTFQNKHTSKNTNTYKTNVYNTEIIDGEYKVIDDEDKKK